MGAAGGIITFVIMWWIFFFAVLPIRPKSVWEEPDAHPEGADRGAPVDPALLKKVLLATAITIPAWLVVYFVVGSGVFDPSR
jgi:predicted secreted protein